jgi:hypothetical protein
MPTNSDQRQSLIESWNASFFTEKELRIKYYSVDDTQFLSGIDIANTVKRKIKSSDHFKYYDEVLIDWKTRCVLKTIPAKCKEESGCISCLSPEERTKVLAARKKK